MDAGRIWTIPPGVPFADALAATLLERAGSAPLALARATVLAPTRRACRTLGEAFQRRAGGRPVLLPRLAPLGDLDADELLIQPAEADGGALDLPPAIEPLRRRLMLARLVGRFRGTSTARALPFADALVDLFDQMATEEVDPGRLAGIVPEHLARHWQITLDFLVRVTDAWAAVLAEEGMLEPAERRRRLLDAQADAWTRRPPTDPILAAGSTGSIPATRRLLAAVAAAPAGAVVLPGFDTAMSSAEERLIRADPVHPQHGMLMLIDALGVRPADVRAWPLAADLPTPPTARAALLRRAFAPSADARNWSKGGLPPDATRGVSRLDAPGPRAEAAGIALALREVLETPGRTGLLVTPDRALARRVSAELARWGVAVDDSGGTPLDRTPVGVFLGLVLAAASGPGVVPLLALAKHPLTTLGRDREGWLRDVRRLDRVALRGRTPMRVTDLPGQIAADGAGGRPGWSRPLDPALAETLAKLVAALEPLATLLADAHPSAAALVQAHGETAERLADSDDTEGWRKLWRGEDGEAAAALLAALAEQAALIGDLAGTDFIDLFRRLARETTVRPAWGGHPRLAILSPMEARMQHADLVVLGGMNEGVWPAPPPIDPWMSAPMRARLGLPSSERRVGLQAHDIAQALAMPNVLLTRADRVGGTPTVPSRWLQRLDAVVDAASGGTGARLPRATDLAGWVTLLDRPVAVTRPPPPAPSPPIAMRPVKLSITEIQTLREDPFAIHARHILRLRKLDDLDPVPDAGEFGRRIHRALEVWIRDWPDDPGHDPAARLQQIAWAQMADIADRPEVASHWRERIIRTARMIARDEMTRRPDLVRAWVEVEGAWTFTLDDGSAFTLNGRVDRVDLQSDGRLAITDYKSGTVPATKDVASGWAPQLPLSALLAKGGFLAGVPAKPVTRLLYWKIGTRETPLKNVAEDDIDALLATTEEGLRKLLGAYRDKAQAYPSAPFPERQPGYSEYDDLARRDPPPDGWRR